MVFFLPLIILAIITGVIYSLIKGDYTKLFYISVLSFAALTFLMREFIRTVNYSKLRIQLVVKMDVCFVLFIAIGVSTLIVYHKITSGFTIITLGAGYFLAAVFGYFNAGDVYFLKRESIKNAFSETWQYSRWTLIGVTSAILMERGYIYIVSLTLGIEVIADISAARLFVTPISFLIASSSKILIAKGAEILNNRGFSRFKKFVFVITFFLILVWTGYILFLSVFYDYIISFLGEKYGNIGGYVLLWGVYFLILSIRFPVTNALVVCKEFKALAYYGIISAVLTITACLVLTGVIQGSGAIISLIIGEMTALLLALKGLSMFSKLNSQYRNS